MSYKEITIISFLLINLTVFLAQNNKYIFSVLKRKQYKVFVNNKFTVFHKTKNSRAK